MHFNRTQFAAKTQIRLLLVAILLLVFLLSSCTPDMLEEFDRIVSTEYKWPATTFSFPLPKGPRFTIDSIRIDSVCRYKVYTNIRFDSTIALTGYIFDYWENGKESEVTHVRQIVVDTIDLSSIGLYFHKTSIKVKPNSEYQIHAMAAYLTGKDTTYVAALPATFRTD